MGRLQVRGFANAGTGGEDARGCKSRYAVHVDEGASESEIRVNTLETWAQS